jgi:hypothetical protein
MERPRPLPYFSFTVVFFPIPIGRFFCEQPQNKSKVSMFYCFKVLKFSTNFYPKKIPLKPPREISIRNLSILFLVAHSFIVQTLKRLETSNFTKLFHCIYHLVRIFRSVFLATLHKHKCVQQIYILCNFFYAAVKIFKRDSLFVIYVHMNPHRHI